ncbi:DUF1249 domain-containing protein [uncultured Porticoccus sp.]|uniref:DUF1249 domain-containing protein n=1 Tax=uncultured Porticoccus sp. TaxID=1256050 RepID=UPI0030DA0E97
MKVRYKVDLIGYMAECDANYLRLMKLFPDMANGGERRVGLRHDSEHVLRLIAREQTAYTTLLELSQGARDGGRDGWFKLPILMLRLYHDARVAEVLSWEGVRQIRPRYDYPNRQMYHQDEKAQWNRFLGEWLSHCLKYGYHLEPLFGEMPYGWD